MRSLIARFVANDTIDDDDGDDQYCQPDPSWNFTDTCNYIQDTDACGGGGYLAWATYVYCCEDPVAKWFIVAAGCLFLLLMFMMLQSSADDFFSPNLSTIVTHLKMSESVAGVTFLAFGNGAPDIFGAIASVLSSPRPKADLALGGLIGAAIFVTLAVHASVVLTTPFKRSMYIFRAAFWSTLRDLVFLLVTASLILSMFLFYDDVVLWQPLTFLAVYIIYVTVVLTAEYYKKKKRAAIQPQIPSTTISRRPTIIPDIQVYDEEGEKDSVKMDHKYSMFDTTHFRRRSTLSPYNHQEEETDAADHEGQAFIVLHNKVYRRDSLRSRTDTMRSRRELWPILVLLKLTIPLSEAPWSKPLVIMHAVLVPQCILFNTQFMFFVPIEGGPGLWAYAPVISVLLIVFILCTTSMNEEPRFYRPIYSYLGFISSVVWIYCISAEVVDVVDMLGVVSGISQAVLGLTLIAWANSIGDLVADISIAKQGYPRMAVAGSIGGPLFNMLLGFGIPFTIAKLEGDTVPIALDGVNLIMIVFLFISILFTMVNVLIFRAHLSRLYGFILVALYVIFLVFIILSETGVLVWLPEP
ncbi:ncx-7 [Pristionchus pacificus]|uniref:Ncx-7 n=1 Tax=Pristionchus pacificus TaxID=54126 RepID=A0A2A6CLC8_PRIPA|nr:ncx-7 [Pristionchus pacificus]|eukprot:PDM78831.1 ncx-7 [Pristionchus pacificus]